MGLMSIRTRVVLAVLAVALGLILLFTIEPCIVLFAGAGPRGVTLSKWSEQTEHLGRLQRWATWAVIEKDVDDPHATARAMSVLTAHLHEDEDRVVRRFVQMSFTAEDPRDRVNALSGLLEASDRNRDMVLAAFDYHLRHTDPDEPYGTEKLAWCISAMGRLNCTNALPLIRPFVNHSDPYLASTAESAVDRLENDIGVGAPRD